MVVCLLSWVLLLLSLGMYALYIVIIIHSELFELDNLSYGWHVLLFSSIFGIVHLIVLLTATAIYVVILTNFLTEFIWLF